MKNVFELIFFGFCKIFRFLKKLLLGFMGGGLIIWLMIVMVLVFDNEKVKVGDDVCVVDIMCLLFLDLWCLYFLFLCCILFEKVVGDFFCYGGVCSGYGCFFGCGVGGLRFVFKIILIDNYSFWVEG